MRRWRILLNAHKQAEALLIKQAFLAFLCAICCTFAQAGTDQQTSNKPVVYLTFDDGPSADDVTDRILAVLDQYNAQATFFVTGARASANPEKIVRILAAGHGIGNHTHSHGNLTLLADQHVVNELNITNVYVRAAGGPRLSCFRAPFGNTDARVDGIANDLGLQTVGWTIDTRDWNPYMDNDYLATQLDDSRHESIVLMHDGPKSRWRTLQVFSNWMKENASSYQFKALPECMQPLPATFAKLESTLTPYKREKVAESIPELLAKLRTYKITLEAEVVAQISSELSELTGKIGQ